MAWSWKLSNNQESGSLKEFREALKNVLEDITALEVNTMIVDEISTEKFDVDDFVAQVKGQIALKPIESSSSAGDVSGKNQIKKERYEKLKNKTSIFKIKFETDKETGRVKLISDDARTIRYFRKLWEEEQSFINGDRVYAQTKINLDGDLTNRFVGDLFKPVKSDAKQEFDPKMTELILSFHRQGAENAQSQWSSLIKTCVDLVKSLISFRNP